MRLFRLLVLLIALSANGIATTPVRASEPDAIILALSAREASFENISYEIRERYEMPPDFDRFQKERYRSAQIAAKHLGNVTIPAFRAMPVDTKWERVWAYLLSKDGKERIQLLDAPGEHKIVQVFDGRQWKSMQDNKTGVLDSSQRKAHLGMYIGFDFNWPNLEIPPAKSRRLAESLALAQKAGLIVDSGREPDGRMRLILRHRARPELGEQVITQQTLWFDPFKRMALVEARSETTHSNRSPKEVGSSSAFESAVWSDFVEAKTNLWIPTTYVTKSHQELYFPAVGDTYPTGFDVDRALKEYDRSGFRTEWFVNKVFRANISKIVVDAKHSSDPFSLNYPAGTVVYDSFTDKAFQVGDTEGVPHDSSFRQPSLFQYSGLIVILLLVMVAVFIAAKFLYRKRRTQ
ncbi:hypothetical protein K2X85_16130 [bacterium]|nr:hypothetical protein [bacterium]